MITDDPCLTISDPDREKRRAWARAHLDENEG